MLQIRPAAASDAAALAQIHVASWRAAYRGTVPDEVLAGLSEEQRAAAWGEALRRAPRSVLLALDAGQAAGFASFGPSRDADAARLRTGELYALYLLPRCWGTGAGAQLWRAARQWLTVEEFSEATLWVLQANLRARRFYEREGWVLDAAPARAVRLGGAELPEVRYRIALG